MEFLSILGSVASIVGLAVSVVGLGVTIWVLYRVRNIERGFLKQALLPSRMKELRTYIGNLERAIKSKHRKSTLQELERCRSLLRASLEYLEGHRRESCELTAEVIHRVCEISVEVDFWTECDRALSRLWGVHEDLKTLVKELEWRTKDAN